MKTTTGLLAFPIELFLVMLATLFACSAASIIEADHPFFGPGTLTRDTAQGLDFLDLPLLIKSTHTLSKPLSSRRGHSGEPRRFCFRQAAEHTGSLAVY